MLIGRAPDDLEEDIDPDGEIDEEGVDGGRPGPGSPATVRLGSNSRDLRTDAGLTLEALATAATGGGGTPATSWLSQVETGKVQIGPRATGRSRRVERRSAPAGRDPRVRTQADDRGPGGGLPEGPRHSAPRGHLLIGGREQVDPRRGGRGSRRPIELRPEAGP